MVTMTCVGGGVGVGVGLRTTGVGVGLRATGVGVSLGVGVGLPTVGVGPLVGVVRSVPLVAVLSMAVGVLVERALGVLSPQAAKSSSVPSSSRQTRANERRGDADVFFDIVCSPSVKKMR